LPLVVSMARQMIVRTEHSFDLTAPGHLTAYCVRETAIEVVSRFLFGGCNGMKLYLFFALIDLMIILAYPVVFILGKLRQILGFKR